jgi:hypothetical protein
MFRSALLLSLTTFCACFAYAQTPPAGGQADAQGWTPAQQRFWYYTSQGSRLMPLSWFQALEQPQNSQPFLTPAYIQSFGLLFDPGGVEGLPIGFASDQTDDSSLTFSKTHWFEGQGNQEPWVGLTCSACHTAQLEFQGTTIRVDGGPSLFDFQSFIEAVDASLSATLNDPARFDRFAGRVLAGKDTAANRNDLRGALHKLVDWENQVEEFNQTPLRYGHGRVDAFGHIFNKVALFAGVETPLSNAADAPVSYPFLWDIYRHNKLQWDGIVEPKRVPLGGGKFFDYGALGRNTGEVLGVFGDVAVQPVGGFPLHAPPLGGYKSSVNVANLDDLETQLRLLKPPPWPGSLDQALVNAGAAIFHQHCSGCHQSQPGTQPYNVKMVPLKQGNLESTDPWMACNALSYQSPTARLKGTRADYFLGTRYGDQAALADMLRTTVEGALVAQTGNIVKQVGRIIVSPNIPPKPLTRGFGNTSPNRLSLCYKSNSPLMAYKARPLNGIWATAPYLHNGSVPTLDDLLLPPAQRPREFYVGTRIYDPVKVGYRTEQGPPTDQVGHSTDQGPPGNVFKFQARDLQGNPIPRNSNEGHDYGVGNLTPEQRRALLEYLKSL